MREYGGYTVQRIEDELTWEYAMLLVDTVNERYAASSTTSPRPNPNERHLNIEDLADGFVPPGLGIAVERKVVN